ncbi:WG repeat-containing protein [Psychrobacter sp. H7-1]|uniref:WG repeat-containing protein n=1 Tax=Psychrobacter sp. H7-1 TaxID=1569265 RepID=UPI0019192B3D|nr:WG repeat-containing protein [Psychrobacter sp. H7-1]
MNTVIKTAATLTLALTCLSLTIPASATLKSFSNDDACGFKNEKGQVVVPAKYDFCGDISDGMAYVGKSANNPDKDAYYTGYINESGKLAIPVKLNTQMFYPNIIFRDFHEGVVAVYKDGPMGEDGKYGYMNKAGKLVLPYQYQKAGDFNKARAVVCKNDKCGVINKSGKTVIPFKFNDLEDYSDGLAKFSTEPWGQGKSGFIDTNGKVVVSARWDAAMPFSQGLAAVRVGDYENGKWGIINKTGKVIVTPIYDNAYIEPEGDAMDVDGGVYENGTINMYNVGNNGSVTRYTLNTQGKVIKKKVFSDWYEAQADLYR